MSTYSKSAGHFLSLPDPYWRKCQGSLFIELNDPITGLPHSRMTSAGSVTASIEQKVEYLDGRDNQTQLRDRIIRRATQADSTMKCTFWQFGGELLSMLYSSPDGLSLDQAASAVQTTEFDNVQKFQILELRDAKGFSVLHTVIAPAGITDGAAGAPNTLIPGVDYRHDSGTGLIQVVNPPESGKFVVTWSAPAVTQDAKQSMYALLQSPDATGRIIVRQNNLNGYNLMTLIPKVHFGTADKIDLISDSNEWQKASFDFTILSDSNYPGYEKGYSILIPDAA